MSWQFPQGIEVLMKKASIDPDFAELLLVDREAAAREIGLELDRSEAMMLKAVPTEQLEAIIVQTIVPHEHRRTFLGKAAAAMLAALGATTAGLAEAGLKSGGAGGIQPKGGSMGIRPEPLENEAKAASTREVQVIAVIADRLGIAVGTISRRSTLAGDLRVDAEKREALRRSLQIQFKIAVSSKTFAPLVTVGDVIDCVDKATGIEPRVIKVIAEELRIDQRPIGCETSLVDDLKVTPAQRSGLRKELSKVFRIYIPWKTFLEFRTVGEVVSYVDKIIKRRDAAKQPKEPPVPPSPVTRGVRPDPPPMSRGNQPDVPSPGSFGGIRPGSPPPPRPSGPMEQAEQARRQAEELRKRMRGGR